MISISIRIRNFRWSDLKELTNLAALVHPGWWAAHSLGNMEEHLGQPNLRPERDLFLAEDRDCLVGYLLCNFEPPLSRVVMDGAVQLDHRGKGIGTILVNAGLALARGGNYQIAHIPISYGDLPTRRLAKSLGFRLVRRYWEMCLVDPWAVPAPKLPDGFTLRGFKEGDEEAFTELHNKVFGQHWGFCPNTVQEISYRVRMSLCTFDGIRLVAKGDKLVGYNWTRIEKHRMGNTGFISMMGSHPDYRGLGLGQIVMRAGVDYLRDTGVDRVELTVDSQNSSALKIYQAAGFRRLAVTLWYQRKP